MEPTETTPLEADEQDAPPGHTVAGWREWAALPDVGVDWIKAKLDTGARTSSIHAFDLEEIEVDGRPHVRFSIHPWQESDDDIAHATLPIHDRREVRSSSGHVEERIVVMMHISICGLDIHSEMTLSRRDEMGFRMLVGREALRQGLLVDPGRSYLGGRPKRAVRRKNRGR